MSNTSSNDWPADLPAVGLPRGLTPAAVEVLVEEAVEAIVGAPSADTVLGLADGLDRAGALWTGVLAVLGPLASRPLAGLGEQESVGRLRRLAETTDLVSRLTHGLSGEFRAQGAAAARTIWDAAPAEVRPDGRRLLPLDRRRGRSPVPARDDPAAARGRARHLVTVFGRPAVGGFPVRRGRGAGRQGLAGRPADGGAADGGAAG
ncbi:hypothetical protein [Kitasatospora griseola]|uniref:hypothetical protein n=1 Tax=Kitasatospora griseola TaxID=2064 RepID=UPI0037FD59AC